MIAVSHLDHLPETPVRISGYAHKEKLGALVSVNKRLFIPPAGEKQILFHLNVRGTRSIGLFRGQDKKEVAILEWRPHRRGNTYEIFHHKLVPGQPYEFFEFALLAKIPPVRSFMRRYNIGARLSIMQAVS